VRKTAFANFKGGVGKTTAAVNVATALRDELRQTDPDARVLLADADSQAGATALLTGRSPSDYEATLAKVLAGEYSLDEALVRLDDPASGLDEEAQAAWGGIDLIPSNPESKIRVAGPEDFWQLRDLLDDPSLPYSHAILDCGYGDTDLTTLALVASDEIVVVTTVTALGVNGLEQLVGKVAKMRRSFPHLRIGGVLANDFSARETADQNVLDDMTKSLGELLWSPAIPHRAIVKRSHDARLPLSVFKVPAARALVEIYASVALRLAPLEVPA